MARFADDLQTGDIALFHGNSWISRGIQRATRSPLSHVGLIEIHPHRNPANKYEPATSSSLSGDDQLLLGAALTIEQVVVVDNCSET